VETHGVINAVPGHNKEADRDSGVQMARKGKEIGVNWGEFEVGGKRI